MTALMNVIARRLDAAISAISVKMDFLIKARLPALNRRASLHYILLASTKNSNDFLLLAYSYIFQKIPSWDYRIIIYI
jgi:hypothetical protein